MARLRQGVNLDCAGVLFSASGAHECYKCSLSNEGFCKPVKRFGLMVSDAVCRRARAGLPIKFAIKDISAEYALEMMKLFNLTEEQFKTQLGLEKNHMTQLMSGCVIQTYIKRIICERMNEFL